MFKKFLAKDDVTGVTQLKGSVQRGLRTKLVERYPPLEKWINEIAPKKESIVLIKCHEHIEIIAVKSELLFFRQRDGPWIPSLRLIHKYPFLLPIQQVDKGAIKFVLSGANIMCPGLTSPGAKLNPAEANEIVAITAEGKEHALCIGCTKMSSENILAKNKGIGVENIHYLNDGLWVMKQLDR
ncbi:malignant T-cell-amplified sequence 1-like [Rhopilema esculentum]|uniref:malignant T-cell-amplified sequence 1-like n=1 Tax=Rhopilema esculentum TaxID=499914 RepID=UPI0031D5BA53